MPGQPSLARPAGKLIFGVDEAPILKLQMALIARAACGHVRAYVRDDGSSSLDRWPSENAAPGLTLERVDLKEAIRDSGECERCQAPAQDGLGL